MAYPRYSVSSHSDHPLDLRRGDGYPREDVSFVELAKVLYRRRWAFFLVLGALLLLVALFTASRPERNLYVSEYSMASTSGGDNGLYSDDQLESIVDSLIKPELKKRLEVSVLPNLELITVDGTSTLLIKTIYPAEHFDLVRKFHGELIGTLLALESNKIEQRRKELNTYLDGVTESLNNLQGADLPQEFLATNQKEVIELKEKLFKLTSPAVVNLVSDHGPFMKFSNTLILGLGLALSVVTALTFVFFAEFLARVRLSLREDEQFQTAP